MAKAIGLAKYLRGKIDGLLFYGMGKETYVKTNPEIKKKRYRTDPRYERLRSNQTEFGMAGKLSKTLRRALHPYIAIWGHSYAAGALTGRFRAAMQKGEGKEGQRHYETALLSLEEADGLLPGKALMRTGKPFQISRREREVYLRMTYGKLKKLFGNENAMPLRIVLGVVALSEVRYENGAYKVQHPKWHGRSAFNERKVLKAWPTKGELRLRVRLSNDEPVPEGVGLVGGLGW